MSTQYTLTVTNNSSAFEQFAIYQSAPNLGNANDLSLAWLVDSADPGAALSFDWSIPSGPDTNQFASHPQYWVASGKFEQGKVSDPAQMTNAVPVVFPPGVNAMQVTLNPDKTWAVAPAAD